MKFCAWLPELSHTSSHISSAEHFKPKSPTAELLVGRRWNNFSSEWMGKAWETSFPLGCGTCLCFVRERCHLSVCGMETKHLLLFFLLLPFGALQGLMDEKFCVQGTCAGSSVHLSQSCFALVFFSLLFIFFSNESKAQLLWLWFFSIVWILSPQKEMWWGSKLFLQPCSPNI